MECGNIRETLSAYIEGVLPQEEKVIIEKHISLCQKCSESLADLKKSHEHVKNLEDIEPPHWLTQNVMARVKAEAAPKRGILERLFYPLRIKIPVQAAATLLIAVATIYIFKTIQPEIKPVTHTELAQAPSDEGKYIARSEVGRSPEQNDVEEADRKDKKGLPPAPKERKQLFSAEKDKITSFQESVTVPAKPTEQPVFAQESETQRYKYVEPSRATGKLEQSELLKEQKGQSPVESRDEAMPSADAVLKDEIKREALPAAPSAKALTREKEPGLHFTLYVKNIDSARQEIEKSVAELEGEIIKTESFENKDFLTAKLDSKRIKKLFERLKQIGELREKSVDFDDREGAKEIRIEVVKITPGP